MPIFEERIQFFQDKARKKQSVQTGSVGNSAVPGPALPVELILTPSSRPKKITGSDITFHKSDVASTNLLTFPNLGKTRTRLPTQMFEGTELNFAEVVDSDPVSPRAPSSGTVLFQQDKRHTFHLCIRKRIFIT